MLSRWIRVFLSSLIFVCQAFGATYIWSGAISSSWTNALNWGLGGYPNGSSDIAQFSVLSFLNQPSLSSTVSVSSVAFVVSGYTLTVGASGLLDVYTSITNNATPNIIDNNGILFFESTVTSVGNVSINNSNSIVFDANSASVSAAITLSGSGIITAQADSNITFLGNISGSGSLTVDLGGVATFVGQTTYSHPSISSNVSGILNIGNGTTTGTTFTSANLAINGSGSLNFNLPSADSLTYAGVISGSTGTVTFQKGRVILTGSNTFTGTTAINGGTAQIGNSGAVGSYSGNITLSSSGSIAFNRTDAPTFNIAITGTTTNPTGIYAMRSVTLSGSNSYSGSTQVDNGATLIFSGDSSAVSGTATVNAGGVLQIGNGGTSGVFGGDIILSGSVTDTGTLIFNRSDAVSYSQPISSSGAVPGNTSIQKSGGGITTLNGSLSGYDGTVIVNAGTLQFNANKAGLGSTTISADTILNIGDDSTLVNTFAGDITNNGTLNLAVPSAETLSVPGDISGSGFSALIKTGEGIANLSGSTLDYQSATTISGGTLRFLSNKIGSSSTTVSGDGILELAVVAATSTYVGDITLTDTGMLQLTSDHSTVSIDSLISAVAGTKVDLGNNTLSITPSSDQSFLGEISGTGNIIKMGSSTLTVGGINSYEGTTTISAGILEFITSKIGVGNTIINLNTTLNIAGGTSFSGDIVDDGTLAFDIPTGTPLTVSGFISGSGELVKGGAGEVILAGNDNTYAGSTIINGGILTFQGDKSQSGIITINANTALNIAGGTTFAGNISNNGSLEFSVPIDTTVMVSGDISGFGALIKLGEGETILSGNNNYEGSTFLNEGMLTVEGNKSQSGETVINDGATLNIGDITGNGTIFGGNITNNGVLNFNISNGTLIAQGAISGSGGFTKTGAGEVVVAGNNSYAGDTIINEGTVTFEGDKSHVGATVIATNTTLNVGDVMGSGTIFAGNIVDEGVINFAIPSGTTLMVPDVISGSQGLTKTGDGEVILAADNSYEGETIIHGGIVTVQRDKNQLGATTIDVNTTLNVGDITGSGTIFAGDIVNEGTLNFTISTGTTLTASGLISGSGGLNKVGAGEVILTADNSYAGITTVYGGTVTFEGDKSQSGTIIVGENTTLNVGNNVANGTVFAGDITTEGTVNVVVSSAGSLSITGNISGSVVSTLNKMGLGIAILSGSVLDYPGPTTISEGTLQFNSNKLGSGSTTITHAAILNVAIPNASSTYAGDITLADTSTLRLSGNNATVSMGSLMGGTTTAGTTLDLGSNTLSITQSSDQSFLGEVTGDGGLIKKGSGSLLFGGSTAYQGVTQVLVGTLTFRSSKTGVGLTTIADGSFLMVGDAQTDGDISFQGNITDNGFITLYSPQGLTITIAGTIETELNQIGSLSKTGSGDAFILGSSSYTGTTQLAEGNLTFLADKLGTGQMTIATNSILKIGDGSSSGNYFEGDIVNNGVIEMDIPDNVTMAMGGSVTEDAGNVGRLSKNGMGTVILQGDINYSGSTEIMQGNLTLTANKWGTGATNIDGGILQIGSLTSSSTVFSYLGDLHLLSGSFALVKGAVVHGLTVDIESLSGTGGAVNLAASSNLVVSQSHDGVFFGTIAGSGTLIKQGIANLTLNGDSTSTFSGSTLIQEGSLTVGDTTDGVGSITNSDVTVDSQGTLKGHGSVHDLTNDGMVSPGTSIGTLSVRRSFIQHETGTLVMDLDSLGNCDLLDVVGTATLDGTLKINILDGFSSTSKYTLLTAGGGVNGTFSNVTILDLDRLPEFIKTGTTQLALVGAGTLEEGLIEGYLVYDVNSVYLLGLNFDSGMIDAFSITFDERSFGDYLVGTEGAGTVASLFASIDPSEYAALANQVSGATYANQQLELADVSNRLVSRMGDRLLDEGCDFVDVDQKIADEQRKRCVDKTKMWIVATGGSSRLESQDVSGLKTTFEDLVAGFERTFTAHFLGGAALSYSHFKGDATVKENSDNHADLFQLGLYGRYQANKWFLGGSLDAGVTGPVKTERFIQASTVSVTTTSSYHTQMFGEQVRTGARLFSKGMFCPFLGLVSQQINLPQITENGATGFELRINKNRYRSLRSQVGIEVSIATHLGPFAAGIWEHEFLDAQGAFDASFAELSPDSTFHVVGQSRERDMGVFQVGFKFLQRSQWQLDAFYEGRFCHNWKSNAANIEAVMLF